MSGEEILELLIEKKERIESQLRIISNSHIEDEITEAQFSFGIGLLDELITNIKNSSDNG